MDIHQIDTLVPLRTKFTLDDGVTPFDPTVVELYVRTPDGREAVYVDVSKESTGVYHRNFVTDQVGPWIYKWRGTGNCDITSPDTYFQVEQTAMTEFLP